MLHPEVESHREVERAATNDGLPVDPSIAPALEEAHVPNVPALIDRRVVMVSGLAVLLALAAGGVAAVLTRLIALFTHLAFYGRVSFEPVSPADNALGPWAIGVPVLGGVVVGLMARYGSRAIRGHGIPEAMEQVLVNESRIPKRMTFLKPLSAAISIGTGGPFGAEGPIIATGGALGSLLGQILTISAQERKTLLAAGAAAGMAATFGSPVAAVLLAIELLLFEYRPRSLVPVALAAATATGVHVAFEGTAPAFAMAELTQPSGRALAVYVALGGLVGVASVLVTRAVYAVEDAFERLPIHWMWWPAVGGLAVGVVGQIAPRTLGVGYDNIERILGGEQSTQAVAVFCLLKFVSWVISLGSGTSGGTLAPLFTIGGGLGATLGAAVVALAPGLGVDVRIAALVGMAAMFAGASRALLASVVFAFETTRQPIGLLPLLGGCAASFLVACLMMRNSIMTEKIVRRGVLALGEYTADYLAQQSVRAHGIRQVVTLRTDHTLQYVHAWIAARSAGSSHQGFPVLDAEGRLRGMVTRKDLYAPLPPQTTLERLITRPPLVIGEDASLRDAADLMAREGIGRLPVVARNRPHTLLGILTRSDLIAAHVGRIDAHAVRFAAPRTAA